ncbi:MAG: flagellar M-ring protein FliF [Burkholderiales bacterium 66-5]|uniref:flagellar basal-body MS-ring/collar protein FliF n=1 Tax=Comamonas badia TaxID=265291 RepID=UPI000427E2D4|nr:flagellar basal-body MS-ring/collar protein FliF [Comamonas badia]OJU91896.1 MAG: flagellar M-ring protein FliF [Burkholderiales bacterium 66-5]
MPSAAVAEMPIAAPVAGAAWPQRLASLDRAARMRLALGLALFLAMVVAAAFFASRPDYRVLFSNLSDKDGGAIVAQLTQMNVPYKYTEGGGAIMVPADRVHDVRLRLASQGLPKGSITGFEVTETSRFGVTQFQERLNFQRGLEGELTRSIQSLAPVQSARVHLALPNQNGFFREQQKPSASVLVSLYPGRFLDRTQLAGIVHLVASSVPDLAPAAVSVLDDTGKLLSQMPDGVGGGAPTGEQLAYVQKMEQQYAQRIVDILAPVVGRDNVKATVNADIDFNQTESTTEQHRPNLAADASAVRSQQVVENAAKPGDKLPAGVPGAVSNQPPQNANAPVNGANPAPDAGAQGGPGAGGGSVGHREITTNYEVDKTTSVTRAAQGMVKRVNAAVVVNYQSVAEAAGKPPVARPLSPEQIEQMTALVREAVGYNKERGDSVNLMNAPFKVDTVAPVELPFYRQPEVIELARSLGMPIGLSLAAVLLLMGVVRPALKAARQGSAAPTATRRKVNAIAAEQIERPALPALEKSQDQPLTQEQLRLQEARSLAKDNPVAVANIVKTWINGE